MKGFKEIVISCVLALTSLLAYNKMRGSVKENARDTFPESPVVSAGQMEDSTASLNWGYNKYMQPRHGGITADRRTWSWR